MAEHAPAPGRFKQGASPFHLLLRSDTDTPIGLTLANPPTAPKGHPVRIGVQYLPELGASQQYIDWRWQNGPAGAGYSRETPLSYQQGGCDAGEFSWLRQDGSVTAAGKLTEIPLPATLTAILTGRIFDAFEWGSSQDLYILTGTQYLLKMASGTGNPGIARDFGAGTATGNAALFGGKAYVSLGADPIQEFDGSIWQAGNSGTERSRLASVNWLLGSAIATGSGMSGGDDVESLLGTDASGTGFYHVVDDPKDSADWSSLIPIGDANFPIQNMVTDGHVAWFGKPNGIHGVNGLGSARNISKWFELASNPSNCGAMVYWNGAIWSVHQQGLVMIPVTGERQDIATFVQFGYDKSSTSPIWGRPRWLCPSPEGLFVAYYNATTGMSYIGCLRMAGNTQLRWSMAECVVPGEVTWMRVTSPGGIPGLLIATLDAGNVMHLYHQDQPESGDPLTDYLHGGSFRPAPEWSLTLSRFNGGTPIEKTFRRHTMETRNLGDGNSIAFQISGDDETTFVDQGTAVTSPYWTGTPTDAHVRAVSAQIRLLCHNAATAPIVIHAVEERYSPHPELQKVKTYPVAFGDGITRKDGRPDTDDPRIKLALFEACLPADPIECIDEFGFTIEAIVEPQVSMVEYEEAATKGFAVYGTVMISTSRQVARWDEAIYDASSYS